MEVALDVLKGCTYSCEGCMVDRDLYATADVVQDVSDMVNEFVDNGFFLFDITIGATDFGSASNIDEVCDNPVVGTLVRKFQTLSITCPMLEKSEEYYVRFADNLLKLTHGETFIRIVMPIGVNYMRNITLMSAIQRRINILQMLLEGALHEVTFILNVTEDLIRKYTYEELRGIYNWPELNMMTDMVLNIPHGRQHDIGTNPKYGGEVAAISRMMSDFYTWMDADDIVQQDPDLDGVTGTHINLGVIGNKIYMIPYLKDEFNIFSEGFAIEKPTYAAAMEKIMEIKDPSRRKLLDMCVECEESPFCTEKGIHKVMEELDITICPVKHNV